MAQEDRNIRKKKFLTKILETGKMIAIKSIDKNINKEIKKRVNY